MSNLVIESSVLKKVPGIRHAFGTRAEPFPAEWKPLWAETQPKWKQVHLTDSAQVIEANQSCGDVDALHTTGRGLPIAVVTADCLPVLLAKNDGTRVAAIHAGWRGLLAGITEKLWEKLASQGEKADQWSAAIGPAIGSCCYEVSPELAEQFLDHFVGFPREVVVPSDRHLALADIQAASLVRLGFGAVELLPYCTRCTLGTDGQPISHSYRREGGGTRQWSAIQITGSI